MPPAITKDGGRIQIRWEGKTPTAAQSALKANGFRYSVKSGWWRKNSYSAHGLAKWIITL